MGLFAYDIICVTSVVWILELVRNCTVLHLPKILKHILCVKEWPTAQYVQGWPKKQANVIYT